MANLMTKIAKERYRIFSSSLGVSLKKIYLDDVILPTLQQMKKVADSESVHRLTSDGRENHHL